MHSDNQMRLFPISNPIVTVVFPKKLPVSLFHRLIGRSAGYSDLAVTVKYDLNELLAFDPGFKIEDWYADFVLFLDAMCHECVRAFSVHIGGEKDRYTHKKYIQGNAAIFEVLGNPIPIDHDVLDMLSNEPRTCTVALEKCNWEIIASYCTIPDIKSEDAIAA